MILICLVIAAIRIISITVKVSHRYSDILGLPIGAHSLELLHHRYQRFAQHLDSALTAA